MPGFTKKREPPIHVLKIVYFFLSLLFQPWKKITKEEINCLSRDEDDLLIDQGVSVLFLIAFLLQIIFISQAFILWWLYKDPTILFWLIPSPLVCAFIAFFASGAYYFFWIEVINKRHEEKIYDVLSGKDQ